MIEGQIPNNYPQHYYIEWHPRVVLGLSYKLDD